MNNNLKSILTLLLLIAVPAVVSMFGQTPEVVCGFLATITLLWIGEAMLNKQWTFLSPYLTRAS